MSTILNPDQAETAAGCARAVTDRLRALRARAHAEAPRRQHAGLPTGWGRWPTFACARDDSSVDRTAACC
jgi:hypothetical protein